MKISVTVHGIQTHRRGMEMGEEELYKCGEARSLDQFGTTKIHHTLAEWKQVYSNSRLPAPRLSDLNDNYNWRSSDFTETLVSLNTQGDCRDSDSQTNKQIKPIPTAAKNITGKQAVKLTWKSVKCVLDQEWVIWISPPRRHSTTLLLLLFRDKETNFFRVSMSIWEPVSSVEH